MRPIEAPKNICYMPEMGTWIYVWPSKVVAAIIFEKMLFSLY